MNYKQAMAALQKAGTAQNRKVYGRHGVPEPMFGVSYAELGRLRKKIGTDHELASQLWESGNHDAQILATMVGDGSAMRSKEIDEWARALDCRGIAAAYSNLVAESRHAPAKAEKWTRARSEFVAACGWYVLCSLSRDPDVDDVLFEEKLQVIEEKIHDERNWVRYAMNQALIAVGVRSPAMTEKALAVAKIVGKVDVDHGQTSCKTPDAAPYIKKTLEHRKKLKEARSR